VQPLAHEHEAEAGTVEKLMPEIEVGDLAHLPDAHARVEREPEDLDPVIEDENRIHGHVLVAREVLVIARRHAHRDGEGESGPVLLRASLASAQLATAEQPALEVQPQVADRGRGEIGRVGGHHGQTVAVLGDHDGQGHADLQDVEQPEGPEEVEGRLVVDGLREGPVLRLEHEGLALEVEVQVEADLHVR